MNEVFKSCLAMFGVDADQKFDVQISWASDTGGSPHGIYVGNLEEMETEYFSRSFEPEMWEI